MTKFDFFGLLLIVSIAVAYTAFRVGRRVERIKAAEQRVKAARRKLEADKQELEEALVDMKVDDWVMWASKNNLPLMGIAFAKTFPGRISLEQPPTDEPFPSYRSFTDAIANCTDKQMKST